MVLPSRLSFPPKGTSFWRMRSPTRNSRLVPIEGVDFLDAGVADHQRGFVGRETTPISEGASGGLKPLEAEDALEFSAVHFGTEVAFLIVEDSIET